MVYKYIQYMSSTEKQIHKFRKDSNAVSYADMIATTLTKFEYYPVYLNVSLHPNVIRKVHYITQLVLTVMINAIAAAIVRLVQENMKKEAASWEGSS